MASRATQERTLGSILGLGIGDALGMPVNDLSPEQIQETYGAITGYHGRTFEDGVELDAGEFSDETEIALCIMETYTSTSGQLDPELIRARMQFLSRDESRRWMNFETLQSLDDENEPWYRSSDETDPEVALRGISIGMIHAAPSIDLQAVFRDVETVVGLTHSSERMIERGLLVAIAVAAVLSGSDDQQSLLATLIQLAPNDELQNVLAGLKDSLDRTTDLARISMMTATGNESIDVITSGIAAFVLGKRFEDAVFPAVSLGGAAGSRGAFAGALAGGHFGAGGIPQALIDELEGRIYLTLAAPWFYRTIQMMTGRGIVIGRKE